MKYGLIVFSLLIVFSCKNKPSEDISPSEETAVNFDWILGDWKRTNDEEGRSTFEQWKKNYNGDYSGYAFTLEDKDTVWLENMTLKETQKEWWLEVLGEDDESPVIFKLTQSTKTSMTLENPKNPFPTKIVYEQDGNDLKAVIYGDGMEIPFIFETWEYP